MKLHTKQRRGFTLIELLVVIAIIAVLAALGTPALLKQLKRAKITKSASVCHAFEVAVNNFEDEYSFLPYDHSLATAPTTDDELRSLDGVITVLAGLEDKINPKKIKFFEQARAKSNRDGMVIDGDKADLYDPWGNPYYIVLDYDYDGEIDHPYDGNAVPADVRKIRKSAICWSTGPDGNEGDKTTRDNPANFE